MVGRPPMRLRNLIVGAIVAASMLTAAPVAFGQSASQDAYSTPHGAIQERISTERRDPPDKTTTTERQTTSSGDLPFTGLDVALIMAAGGVLLAMGFGMRRLSRSEVV
jgi:hypothetical protein